MPDAVRGRPRLIFVNRFFHPDLSATSQILTDLAVELAATGVQVEVLTSRLRYESGDASLPADDRHRGVAIRRVSTTSFGRGTLVGRSMDYLSFLSSVRREVSAKAGERSVVIAKTDPPMLGAFLWKRSVARGGAFVNWVQDLFPEVAVEAGIMPLGALGAKVLAASRNRAFSRAAATIAVGERMAERIRATGVVAPERVHVIHNWADGRLIRPRARESNALRSSLGLDGKFVVGYSGNFGRVHEFGTLLDAVHALKDDDRIRFLFIGAGKQLRDIQAFVARERLGNVVLAPYQPRERLGESLSASDVHLTTLHPKYEGLVVPSKVYGIMAAGRPCIFVGDRDGEVARLIDRGRFGFNVPMGDAPSLIAAVRHLASAPDEQVALGSAARRMFDAEFDLPLAVARWKSVLRGVLRRADAAASFDSGIPEPARVSEAE